MKLGPDPIEYGRDSDAVRDRKACEGAVHHALMGAGQSEIQAHNGIRTYRSSLLEEAAEAVSDPSRRKGLGWKGARDLLLSLAKEARAERTYRGLSADD